MEPISTVVGIAIAGAATGKVVEKAWDAGSEWIATYLGKHGAETQARARANTIEFLGDLAKRLDSVEAKMIGRGVQDDMIDHKLSDPDFAAVLQSALIASARTDDREKHQVLADAVAARLQAPPDSMRAITASLAVEVIPKITSQHLQILGLIYVLFQVRPGRRAAASQELANAESIRWLQAQLRLFPEALRGSGSDILYLDGLGCLRELPNIMEVPLEQITASLIIGSTGKAQFDAFLRDVEAGISFREMWDTSLKRATPTPVGVEIGAAVHRLRSQ